MYFILFIFNSSHVRPSMCCVAVFQVRADKAESDSKKLKASTARLRGQVVNLEAELKQRLRQEVEVG